MDFKGMKEAIGRLEKVNDGLEPELLTIERAREALDLYARAEKLCSYGKTVLATRLDDANAVARTTGVSLGKAKAIVDSGVALKEADEVRDAFKVAASPWTRQPRSLERRRLAPGSRASCWRWPTRSPFTSSRRSRGRSCSRPSSTAAWPSASTTPALPGASLTN
jgi:hypothetical protein